MIEKTPGRRRKAPELRKVSVNTSMTLEQREMFLTLGGSAWLQKMLDAYGRSKAAAATRVGYPYLWNEDVEIPDAKP